MYNPKNCTFNGMAGVLRLELRLVVLETIVLTIDTIPLYEQYLYILAQNENECNSFIIKLKDFGAFREVICEKYA